MWPIVSTAGHARGNQSLKVFSWLSLFLSLAKPYTENKVPEWFCGFELSITNEGQSKPIKNVLFIQESHY